MAKKRKNKRISSHVSTDERLPQNIYSIGEHVEVNKNIYIYQSVYKAIHHYTVDKVINESGGVLVGNVIEQFGKMNIIIHGFIEAKFCEATPTTLKITHETWEYFHKVIAKKFPDKKIIGWIHTHPDFGIFLSEYDKFIQENFFKEDYDIAYVVDPIQNIEGFYFWINGQLERCKGFYLGDKTGNKIRIERDEKKESEPERKPLTGYGIFRNIILGLLSLVSIILLYGTINLNGKVSELQNQQRAIVDSANQNFAVMQQQISDLQNELEDQKLSQADGEIQP